MSTLASAKKSYAEKLPVMPSNYIKGVARFLGVSESAISGKSPVVAYKDRVKPGLENVWEAGVKARWGV